MKNKLLLTVFIAFTLFTSCKKIEEIKPFGTTVMRKDTLADSELEENSFNKTDFKDRAEELIYIREYLKYKLPRIMIKQKPELVKKAQYLLISFGGNPTLIQAAERAVKYSGINETLMVEISSGNLSFEAVKKRLKIAEEKGFDSNTYPLPNETDNIDYERKLIGDEIINDISDEISTPEDSVSNSPNYINENDTRINNTALSSFLKGANKSVDGSGNGLGTSSGYGGGFSLGNRIAISKPSPEYKCNEEGTIIVQISVDRNGRTISAIAGVKGTTNTARCLLDEAKIAAMNTKWEARSDGPEKEIGKIVYNFKLTN